MPRGAVRIYVSRRDIIPPVMLILKVLPSCPSPLSIVELIWVSPLITVYGARASIREPAMG